MSNQQCQVLCQAENVEPQIAVPAIVKCYAKQKVQDIK